MIIVKGSIPVKTAHREEAVDLVQRLARASRDEHGCLAYEVYIQADAPEVIMVWQQWSDLDALETHFASDHVDSFLDAIPDLIEGQVTSARFDVSAFEDDSDFEDQLELPQVLMDGIVLH